MRGSAEVHIRPATAVDHDDLFRSFSKIVDAKEGFPQAPPLRRPDFDEYWLAHSASVAVVLVGEQLAGAYYLKANFVGRASHIANAGYFLSPEYRGHGFGAEMVRHSLASARQLGFDALQFNLVFASNPARRLYERLGFQQVGRVPAAVEGEDALIYWRAL